MVKVFGGIRHHQVHFPVVFLMLHGQVLHVDFLLVCHMGIGAHRLFQLLNFFRRSIVFFNDHAVIQLNFLVLEHCHIHNGIPQTKAHQQQGHTAANTKNRHQKPLFVPEQIAHRRFPAEA